MLRRNESEVGHQSCWSSKATDIIDLAEKGKGCKRFDSPQTTEGFNLGSVGHGSRGLFKLGIKGTDLGLEILQELKIDRQSGLEMSLERLPKFAEPEEVLLCPCGLRPGKDVTVVAQGTGDAVFGSSDVGMITSSKSQESA